MPLTPLSPQMVNTFRQFMSQNPNNLNSFKELSRILPYTCKQLYNLWNDKVDPRLNTNRFNDERKEFIYNWGNNNQGSTISWRNCQREMLTTFGEFHSPNKIKNAYNSKRRSQRRQRLAQAGTPSHPYTRLNIQSLANNDIITTRSHTPPPIIEPRLSYTNSRSQYDLKCLSEITHGYRYRQY